MFPDFPQSAVIVFMVCPVLFFLAKVMNNAIRTASSDLRIRCLDGLCAIFKASPLQLDVETLTAVQEFWYVPSSGSLPSTAELVWKVAREPFQDVRCAALKALAAIAAWPLICRELVALPGFAEYALNRSTESEKLCKEAKFKLVANIAHSEIAGTYLGISVWSKFRDYVSQGPLFVQPESAVKTDKPDD